MITLANLSAATEQEVFDQVARHLLNQKEKSEDCQYPFKKCQYRSKKNGKTLSCAAGCLMSDEEAQEIIKLGLNQKGWPSLIVNDKVPNDHEDLIIDLQLVHDHYSVDEWKSQLQIVAERFKLDDGVLKEI